MSTVRLAELGNGRFRVHVVLTAFLMFLTMGGRCMGAQSPDLFALKLEQVPGTTDVLVVGSWDVDRISGFSWGICYDPKKARIGDCAGLRISDPDENTCSCVDILDDLAFYIGGWSPGFYFMSIYENGITQAAIIDMWLMSIPMPVDRFEMLKISYTTLTDSVELAFCDTLGDPATETLFVSGGNSIFPATQEGLVLVSSGDFIRGDANGDGRHDLADAIYLFQALFRDGPALGCLDAGDANDDGELDLADVIGILSYLFAFTGPMPEPMLDCGPDPTAEYPALSCLNYAPCP